MKKYVFLIAFALSFLTYFAFAEKTSPVIFKQVFENVASKTRNSFTTSPVIGKDMIAIFPGSFKGHDRIWLFDKTNGKTIGNIGVPNEKGELAIYNGKKDILFYRDADFHLCAAELTDKKLLWCYKGIEPFVDVNPVVDNQNNVVYFVTGDGSIHAFAVETGKEFWSYRAITQITTTPLVMEDNIYFGCADGTIYCINKETHSVNWTLNIRPNGEGYCGRYSNLVYYDGKIYFINDRAKLYCLEVNTGKIIFKTESNYEKDYAAHFFKYISEMNENLRDFFLAIPPKITIGDGKLFLTMRSDYVLCLNPKDGKKIWTFQASNFLLPQTYYKYKDEYVIVGSMDGTLYILDAETGKLKATFEFDGDMLSEPQVNIGNIYFSAMIFGKEYSTVLYCINLNSLLKADKFKDAETGVILKEEKIENLR